jgi:hypothetical protein
MRKGNPTYNPDFHPDNLIERMTLGELDVQVYAAWQVSKKTFYKWLSEHEDFKEAYEIGLPACESWWLTEMKKKWQQGDEKGFKYCALIVNTKFGYRENQSPSVTNNTQINIQGNMNVLQEKSRAELIDFISSGLEDNNIINTEFKQLGQSNGSKQED